MQLKNLKWETPVIIPHIEILWKTKPIMGLLFDDHCIQNGSLKHPKVLRRNKLYEVQIYLFFPFWEKLF